MSAPQLELPKTVRLDLEQRQAFILNVLYGIGLAYTAHDEKQASLLRRDLLVVMRGPRGVEAMHALAAKMGLVARAPTAEDLSAMALDP